ncbi:DUF6702 family protein [Prosthecobacter sp. SYSU 5D2]|uniref:DUF6702 family protein n=1 Tax=Prosthecobacter sp. SYSU 5D2 TaxID=3134134 RepID=UPI0031FF294A
MPALILGLLLLAGPGLQAHPVHQSQAQAEFNLETRKLEVSLTVFINDLEQVLTNHSGQKLSFEKTEAALFDAQVQMYLAETFVLKDGTGNVATMEWLGRELEPGSEKSAEPEVTLFFELSLPHGIPGSTLRHTLFCEVFEDQSNLLRFTTGTKKIVWCFLKGDGEKPLPAP